MKVPWLFVVSSLALVSSNSAISVTNGTTSSYDPAELLTKIFQPNITLESRQRGYGLVKFEEQPDPGLDPDHQDPGQYGLIDPEREQRPLRFEDDYDQNYNTNVDYHQYSEENKPVKFQDTEDYLASNNGVTFQDSNNVDDQGNKKKRKRRRRRKPKNGVLPYAGVGVGQGRPGADGGRPAFDGYQGPYQPGYGLYQNGNPGYPGVRPLKRPRRPRPRPSLATEALSSITGALTSIALYDDYQCVPRLLCEAAGGGALSSNGVLQSIAGIQPLLTLLSAYNGISTSPLFVFGRAVFLGMTSQGNTGTCRYAYPQCPTDPEQLIHYLNNHNGGFFRFFNAPQLPNQNVEQFYNQLGNQGYGIYQPQQNPAYGNPDNPNIPYGYPNDLNSGQHYGLYQHNQGQNYGQNYGFQRPNPYEKPGLYDNQNHGSNYAYDYNNYGSGNQIRFKNSEAQIQKRIQNKPVQNLADIELENLENDDVKTKWQFPEDQTTDVNNYNVRDSRTLKFPEGDQSHNKQKDSPRKGKQAYYSNKNYHQNYYDNQQHVFSNNNRYETSTYSYNNGQNNQNYYTSRPAFYNSNNNYKPPPKYHNYNYNPSSTNNAYQNQQNYYNNKQNIYSNNQKYQPTTVFNNEEYVFDHKHNFYVKKENNNNYSVTSNPVKYNTNNYYNNGNNYYNTNNNNIKRNEDNGLKTVYVVRGNGDPNNPEIVKLRPGQSVH